MANQPDFAIFGTLLVQKTPGRSLRGANTAPFLPQRLDEDLGAALPVVEAAAFPREPVDAGVLKPAFAEPMRGARRKHEQIVHAQRSGSRFDKP